VSELSIASFAIAMVLAPGFAARAIYRRGALKFAGDAKA
jgi:hypothetical protein